MIGEVIYMVYDGSADLSSDLPQPLNGMYFTNTYSAAEQPPEPTPTPDNGDDMSESDGSVTAHED